MNKFECLVQAHEYEQMTYGRGDFEEFQGLSSKIKSLKVKKWLALLQQKRQVYFSKQRQRTAEKADDKTYLHTNFLINCLKKKAKVLTDLKIRLLEKKINEGIAVRKKCSIVYRFSESMKELCRFEMKIQKPNYALLLNFSEDEMQRCIDNERVSFLSATTSELTDIKNHLKKDEYFKKVNDDESIKNVSDLVKKTVAEFVQHAEKRN
ncbi:hypothetical protein AJ78_08351 [Emergomyces pasteurianus Ep9510]|uniref:Uncharacterized protein n=1 Tax=Emergomyces pasteurianus Ep9510 TaxID=1447872 RepID=A0A1J9P4B9_9EURO|nr:hypothetical protein AJ78_08351 [Emergomyces pasteurianus Ep9510]